MLPKLRLDQTNKYAMTIATYEISNMLVDFINGQKHYLSIGSEQGSIQRWDDLVIEKDVDHFIQVQIKRQTGNFCSDLDECNRNKYERGRRIGEYRDLSEFDLTIKSLADWSLYKDLTNLKTKREFWFDLPDANCYIKNNLQVKHLKDLCDVKIKSAVTNVQGLIDLADQDNNIRNCFDWLTSWCDFKDWVHIFKALQLLKIKDFGTEHRIEEETEKILKNVFITDKIRDVRLLILSYIEDNTTFTGAISPRHLLLKLKTYLNQDVATWTQFEKIDSQWNISGIHDLEYNTEIERPSCVVPLLWNNNATRHLKINAPSNCNCKLSDSLIRLSIHQTGSLQAQYSNLADWKAIIKNKTGGTLGNGEYEIDQLTLIENRELFAPTECKRLIGISEQDVFSSGLEDTMREVTWNKLKDSIENKILSMNTNQSHELRNAVDIRWNLWKSILEVSHNEQNDLFANMLHPKAEGDDICSALRVGVKTVNLLADGLLLLLIVSVCLDKDGNGNWKKISNELSINTICLQYWSGLAGTRKKVVEIIDGCVQLIGKEKANLLIMSKVQESYSGVLASNMSDSLKSENTLADGKQLTLLVTNNSQLRRLIKEGNVENIRIYLKSISREKYSSNQETINRLIS